MTETEDLECGGAAAAAENLNPTVPVEYQERQGSSSSWGLTNSLSNQAADPDFHHKRELPSMTATESEKLPGFYKAQLAAQEFREGMKHVYYRDLWHAANKGDWETVKSFIDCDRNALTDRITSDSHTVLKVAADASRWELVEKLVEMLPPKELAAQDVSGNTVLHTACYAGNFRVAKALVRKNPRLPQTVNFLGFVPLFCSLARHPCKELVWYLCLVTRDVKPGIPFTGPNSHLLVRLLCAAGFHDITMYLLKFYPELAVVRDEKEDKHLLLWLTQHSSHFQSGSNFRFWERWIYKVVPVKIECVPPPSVLADAEGYYGDGEAIALIQPRGIGSKVSPQLKTSYWDVIEAFVPCVRQIRKTKLIHNCAVELVKEACDYITRSMKCADSLDFLSNPPILLSAASTGIVEVITTCLRYFPDLVYRNWTIDDWKPRIIAIQCRRENVFNLMKKEMPLPHGLGNAGADADGNALHIAGKLAPPAALLSVSGVALQLQRELQWFKEVEKMCHPLMLTQKNADGKTPWEFFWDEHKDMAEHGEKWMKDTANSCMVVSTLIATIVFAAAFTVPGGNTEDKGIPIFLWTDSFVVFAIADALALFSSTTSLLMFLSTLTARYGMEDFLVSLPKKLIIGLGSLFFAIATMMVAFVTAFTIVLNDRWKWVSIPITLMASFPVAIFAMLQLPLFIQMVHSTCGPNIFR